MFEFEVDFFYNRMNTESFSAAIVSVPNPRP